MRYISTLLLILLVTFGYSQEKINVVASATLFADMAKQIGGDKVSVESICSVGTDPHTYEPIPSDVQLMKKADAIFINGLTLEGWMEKLIKNSGGKGMLKIITDGVSAISNEHFANSYDPHAWMNVNNGRIYAKNIMETLCKVDPKNADYYKNNFANYDKELIELHQYIKEEINSIPEQRRVLVTSHDAFEYYSRAYGIKVEALQGMSTEAEAQTSDMIRVNKIIKESGVPAIFAESTINPKMQEQIAKQNDVVIGGELYADSLGEEGGHADTYAKMLKHNTDTIVKALKNEKPTHSHDSEKSGGNNIWLYVGIGLFMLLALLLAMKFIK